MTSGGAETGFWTYSTGHSPEEMLGWASSIAQYAEDLTKKTTLYPKTDPPLVFTMGYPKPVVFPKQVMQV